MAIASNSFTHERKEEEKQTPKREVEKTAIEKGPYVKTECSGDCHSLRTFLRGKAGAKNRK